MNRLTVACALTFCLVSCGLFQPTYKDADSAMVARLKVATGAETTEQLLTNYKPQTLTLLSEEFKLPVQDAFILDGTLVAEIQPAADQASEEAVEEGLKDPTNPASWARAGSAAAIYALMGLLGLRGRSTRRKEETNAEGEN